MLLAMAAAEKILQRHGRIIAADEQRLVLLVRGRFGTEQQADGVIRRGEGPQHRALVRVGEVVILLGDSDRRAQQALLLITASASARGSSITTHWLRKDTVSTLRPKIVTGWPRRKLHRPSMPAWPFSSKRLSHDVLSDSSTSP
jgi:hypothetical protein